MGEHCSSLIGKFCMDSTFIDCFSWLSYGLRECAQYCPVANACIPGMRVDKIRNNSGSGPCGHAEDYSAEHKHDCSRKCCSAPVAIDNADHVQGDCPTYDCHSGHSLDGTPVENRSSTTKYGVAANGSMVMSPTPLSCTRKGD